MTSSSNKNFLVQKANIFLLLFFITTGMFSCSGDGENSGTEKDSVITESMSFKTLTPEESGVVFTNTITETDSFNFLNYEYIYNGGGVATGDINNDGLADIYFTGNQVSDKLFLNKGNLKFEEITKSAFTNDLTLGWKTGVVMADVNSDGWLDIYVSRSGNPQDNSLMANQLFINNKDLTFKESAAEYGLDSKRPSTQAAFFDYDNDGDLDVYIINHPYNSSNTREDRKSVQEVEAMTKKGSPYSDQLFRNDMGKYTDVSKEAGILNHAFGLGLAVGDINGDGFEDIYVSNDYMAPDYLYMNQGNGTFIEEIKIRTGHISNYSMGNDMADFNNDGFLDIITVDMVSEDHIRSKKNMSGMSTKKFWDVVNAGYYYQYMFNALQLNNGDGTFSEIAQLSGVSKTDWSWAPLFADFDNDGQNDLFITNGYRRDSRDNDYLAEVNTRDGKFNGFEEVLDLMPASKIQNYMFHNDGELRFSKVMDQWGINQPINSNGAAYADLDNDGDLDIVLNNMDEPSSILENELKSNNGYLKIKVVGPNGNKSAIGTKVILTSTSGQQFKSLQTERGYQSSVDPVLHFGLGTDNSIEEIRIQFYDGKSVVIKDAKINSMITVDYKDSKMNPINKSEATPLFTEIKISGLDYTHKELFVNDFEKEILLPNKMSQLGPFISSGDLTGDGVEDIYISGSRGFAGSLYAQTEKGEFRLISGPWEKEKMREEMGSAIFDVDNDGDNDLLVISGSNEYNYNSTMLMPQLYINDGKGNFKNETTVRLPKMETSGQRVALGDYDADGDLDVYIGGRQTPGFYPFSPRSYLLKNNGGIFEDVTAGSTDLMGPGMITESLFDDFDNDGDLDLICVGEWMPISFFENKLGVFENVTEKYNLQNTVGWWMSIEKGDFNGDGINDYVVGNIGENNKFHPDKDHPLEIYCHDFDGNGTYDIVLGKYQNGICYPVRGRQCSSEQMPFIQQKFPSYSDFAVADLEKIYGKENLEKSLHYTATNFSSSILLSDSKGYNLTSLPVLAQFGPLNGIEVMDLNKDSHLDIIACGNNFGAEVETIRYDGGCGTVLLGNGNGSFEQRFPKESGFLIKTDAKDMARIGNYIYVVSNNSAIQSYRIN